jgi:hypothetical protein
VASPSGLAGEVLKRFGNKNRTLKAVFGEAKPEKTTIAAPAQSNELIRAKEEFDKAQQALEQRKWQDFGNAMEALKKILD